MTKEQFTVGWIKLARHFGQQSVDVAKDYLGRFQNYDAQDWFTACDKCLDELEKFPKYKHLIERLPGHQSEAMSAEAAWTRVLHAASNDAPWSRTDSANNIPSMPTGQGLDQATLDAIGGPRGLYRLAAIIEQQPGRLSYERRDFLTRFGQLGNLNAAGYLPDGQKQVEVDLIEDGYSNDHLLTDGYDAEGYDA